MDIPVSKTKRRITSPSLKLSLLIGGLLIAVFFSHRYIKVAVPTVNQTDVWISQVKQGEFIREIRGVGVLVPSEIRWIAAASAGRVERVLVKPWAYITQDTVIAELSNPELVSKLQQAKWELDAAEANLIALEAQLQEQSLEQELYVKKKKMPGID